MSGTPSRGGLPRFGLPRAEVPGAFDGGAAAYDALVGANPGYHDHLRISARRMRIPDGGRGLRLLDAGCGTGASTAALLEAAPHAQIIGVDASAGMLEQAAAKSWPDNVRFVHSPIEEFTDGEFDGILAAYLIRNLADPEAQLRRFMAMLRPGAPLALHEYSVADSRSARAVWNAVCWGIIIPAGWRKTGDSTLYRHLWRSVNTFDGATRFQSRLSAAGFTGVHSETVPGWQRGIVHTFIGEAPR